MRTLSGFIRLSGCVRRQRGGERPYVFAVAYDLPVMTGRSLLLAVQFVERARHLRRTRRGAHRTQTGTQDFDAEQFKATLLVQRLALRAEIEKPAQGAIARARERVRDFGDEFRVVAMRRREFAREHFVREVKPDGPAAQTLWTVCGQTNDGEIVVRDHLPTLALGKLHSSVEHEAEGVVRRVVTFGCVADDKVDARTDEHVGEFVRERAKELEVAAEQRLVDGLIGAAAEERAGRHVD